jgi:hypothetical protein
MIVKIQKPIIGSDVLIYNENRRVWYETPLTPELETLFPDGELKVYHRAYINKNSKLVIKKRVPDQDW